MSDLELAVTRCKSLESLLETGFGADGRGLHEKVSSVEARLPPPLVKKLRFVATVRNKIVHETDYTALDDRSGFARACDDAERQLKAMLPGPKIINKGCLGVVLVGGLVAAAAVAARWL